MKLLQYGCGALLAVALAACGGGGGSAGTTSNGGTAGGSSTVPAYQMGLQLLNAQGTEIANRTFPASETVRLQATLKTANGSPAAYQVVSFAETGSGLLQFAPASATALTNASGLAVLDIQAKTLDAVGATTVTASANVNGTAYTAATNLAVTATAVQGTDPQMLAKSIGFQSVVPADQSIVIAGAGGTGRAETAILQFKVVDGSGSVVPGVRVQFATVPADVVTLNTLSGTTDANGIVSTSVSSKSLPTTVVVRASVPGTSLSTQSDTLTVTTGPAVNTRLDLSANKYVLNHDVSGDSSTITVRVADTNGQPVADGFALVAVTDYGSVGTSSRAGCTTANGACTIDYRVQNPRPLDGTPIRVTVSGASTAGDVSGSIFLNATSVRWVSLYPQAAGTPVTSFSGLSFDAKCNAVWTGRLGTAAGFAAPAGATLTAQSFNSQVNVAVTGGSPVKDSLGKRTPVDLTFSLDNTAVAGTANLRFTVSAGVFEQQFAATLAYPACTPAS